MLAAERRNIILEKLQEEKKVVVSELSVMFDVSEETIRRDLDKLDREGLAVKSYGGATLNENTSIDMPFNIRKKKNVTGKQKIADQIQKLVEEQEHIMLDPSSTAVFIARALKKREKLTVITNSLEVMIELSDMPEWEVIATGGGMKGEYLALVGTRAVEELSSYYVEKTIFSCKGFDLEKGMTEANVLFAEAKQAMMRQAAITILAVDSTKFGKVAFAKVCDADEIDIVVTDERPTEEYIDFFAKHNITCIY